MKRLFNWLRGGPAPVPGPRRAVGGGPSGRDQVIGLCRFSYPAVGGFQRQHDSPGDRARYLYAPARLEERFRLFETVALPAIRGQTDPDFTFLVVIGEDFPQRPRLEGLLADVPQARILAFAPRRHREVMKEAINSVRDMRAPLSIQFRLDDDDGVNLRVVERLRQVARDGRRLLMAQPKTAIDFNHGHVFRASARGIEAERVTRGYWAPGLAVAVRQGNPQTVMNFAHQSVWQHMPAISLTDRDMFLRGLNPHNDSEFRPGAAFQLLDAEGEDRFRAAYGVDAARVRAVWRDS
jgi:hypothetical protein